MDGRTALSTGRGPPPPPYVESQLVAPAGLFPSRDEKEEDPRQGFRRC
ncbi:hypothetical protein OG885_15665 [Streptomyces sp. NBC_00028]